MAWKLEIGVSLTPVKEFPGNFSVGVGWVPGTPGAKYLVPSTWCQVLGSKYLVPSTWCQVLVTESLVPSTWYQILGTKYLVPSTLESLLLKGVNPPLAYD